jgi:hypothetical protein
MKSKNDHFLDQILSPTDDFRKSSLEATLRCVRQRNHHRRAVRACAVGLVTVLLALAGVWKWAPNNSHLVASKLSTDTQSSERVQTSETKIISDQELFALFPNRPVALIGKPGNQELVFLDQ